MRPSVLIMLCIAVLSVEAAPAKYVQRLESSLESLDDLLNAKAEAPMELEREEEFDWRAWIKTGTEKLKSLVSKEKETEKKVDEAKTKVEEAKKDGDTAKVEAAEKEVKTAEAEKEEVVQEVVKAKVEVKEAEAKEAAEPAAAPSDDSAIVLEIYEYVKKKAGKADTPDEEEDDEGDSDKTEVDKVEEEDKEEDAKDDEVEAEEDAVKEVADEAGEGTKEKEVRRTASHRQPLI